MLGGARFAPRYKTAFGDIKMIGRDEIERAAELFQIHPSHVQRDYVHGWLLSGLFSSSELASRLVLKGGNCLRKGYFQNFRYSRDLDFTTPGALDHDLLGRELNQVCTRVSDATGVRFELARTRVDEKREVDEKRISQARVYFQDFYGTETELVLSVRVDVAEFDRLHLPPARQPLIHPYSDAASCSASISCVKLEELLATKMRCLLQRRHIADLFDLAYSTYSSSYSLNLTELLAVFFRITVFRGAAAVVKGLFLDLPLDALGKFWANYIDCPAEVRFSFDTAKARLLDLVEKLLPGRAERHHSTVFFPSAMRNPIMEAADSLTMLRLTYDGSTRLVEPYSLVFKTKKGGDSHEYLYAYDTTGGRSGPGLKSFLPGRVHALENTDQKFEPRHEVHLRQAGGAETARAFEGVSRPGAQRSSRYVVECSNCGKRFYRSKAGTTIKAHLDGSGRRCSGRRGSYV